jgi:hypothetical protein
MGCNGDGPAALLYGPSSDAVGDSKTWSVWGGILRVVLP